MNQIVCPHCGMAFTIDESNYDSIVKQIRDHEFAEELQKREDAFQEKLKMQVALLKKEFGSDKEAAVSEKDKEINAKQATIDSLNSQFEAAKKEIERLKEQGGDPGTGNTCPKCGGTHANDFFGKIVCFFNQIGNFFKNLFK